MVQSIRIGDLTDNLSLSNRKEVTFMKAQFKHADLDSLAAIRELDTLIAHLRCLRFFFKPRGDPSSVHWAHALKIAERLRDSIEVQSSSTFDWPKVVEAIAFIANLAVKMWD